VGLNFGVCARAGVLALTLLPATGCSWLFVAKPPEPPIPASPSIVCTTSVASPVIDTVAAGLLAGLGVATIVAANPQASGTPCTDYCGLFRGLTAGIAVGGAVLVAAAVPLAFSAGHGYATTSDCRRLKEMQLACVSGVEGSCAPLRGTSPSRQGKAAGEPCVEDVECREGRTCVQGRCQE